MNLKIRKFFSAMRDSALEQWPFIKPWIKWFSDEVEGLRKGWLLFAVLALVVAGLAFWLTRSGSSGALSAARSSLAATNSHWSGRVEQLERSLENERRTYESKITDLKIDHNEVARAKDVEISNLKADKNSALERVALLESLRACFEKGNPEI